MKEEKRDTEKIGIEQKEANRSRLVSKPDDVSLAFPVPDRRETS